MYILECLQEVRVVMSLELRFSLRIYQQGFCSVTAYHTGTQQKKSKREHNYMKLGIKASKKSAGIRTHQRRDGASTSMVKITGERHMAVTWGQQTAPSAVVSLVTAAVVPHWDFQQSRLNVNTCKPFTFDMKIQTPTCSREKPLFSLTVAISRRKPSRALRRDKDGREDSDLCEKNRDAFKHPRHLAQQPPWNVWDVRKGNSRTPMRSPERRRQTADTAKENGDRKEGVHGTIGWAPVGWAARARSSRLEERAFTWNHQNSWSSWRVAWLSFDRLSLASYLNR